jgi:hypothetical protein
MKTDNELLYAIDGNEIDVNEFREKVAKNAYYRAEKRGFEDGYELEDWFDAEQEIRDEGRY